MSLSFSTLMPGVNRVLQRMRAACDLHSCRNKQIVRSFPGGRQGVRVGQRWYCSVDCFVQAARAPLFALSSRRIVEIPRSPRLSLGLAMLSKGYLTQNQLRTATDQSHRRNESLDRTLLHLGMATEKQLAVARSAQWGYPVLAQEHIGHMVRADIPPAILDACSAVPLHYSLAAQRIVLGFVLRVEHGLLESIEQVTGCRVEPCFITATDLAEQMERLTRVPGYNEVLIDDPGTPEKMARTVGRMAVEVGAREACFTQCKNNVWVRLTGKRGIIDVIFRAKNEVIGAPSTSTSFLDLDVVSLR